MNSQEEVTVDKVEKLLTEGINWLIIVAMLILNVALSLMSIKEGSVALNDYSHYNWLDWVAWGVMNVIPAVLALIVDSSFNKEGIRKGKKSIKKVVDEYNDNFKYTKSKKVRSEKEYLRKGVLKKSVAKFGSVLVVSVFTTQLILGYNAESVVKLIVNIAMWFLLGFMSYRAGFEFTTTELREWYVLETEKLKKEGEKDEKIIPNVIPSSNASELHKEG